jgi:hypothetical protein
MYGVEMNRRLWRSVSYMALPLQLEEDDEMAALIMAYIYPRSLQSMFVRDVCKDCPR